MTIPITGHHRATQFKFTRSDTTNLGEMFVQGLWGNWCGSEYMYSPLTRSELLWPHSRFNEVLTINDMFNST